MEEYIRDQRGREWELFLDLSYFEMWCVRFAGDRDFCSPTSFHFVHREDAQEFLRLLGKSS